jgi:hypothetical protein
VWSINITTSAQKIALLFVGPPKHNLLLKVDLEEVSHNFLVTRAFCWQGIVTIQTPCFVCYWGVNKVDFTYNGGLFSLGQCNMKLTTQRGSILTTRECANLSSHKKFLYNLVQLLPHSQSFTNPMNILTNTSSMGLLECGVDLVEVWPLLECSCSWVHDDIGPVLTMTQSYVIYRTNDQHFGHCAI